MCKLPEVRDAAVIVHGGSGVAQLVAYIVATDGAALTPARLRERLQETLPAYMIPSQFVSVEALPLTPNGKVDRRALADTVAPADLREELVAPRDAFERTVAMAFASVLSVGAIGVHDNFFALGGHSLLAVRLVNLLRAAFHVELPLRALFEAPTVEELARRVAEGGAIAAPATESA